MTMHPLDNGISAYDAIVGRRSTRRFTAAPVAEEIVEAILGAASRAASGMNMQPWLVHVVTGKARERLSLAVRNAAEQGLSSPEYSYVPSVIKDPYAERRRKVGFALYELYGIERHDIAARREAMLRNFDFFGAPVGLFFTMDRAMTAGSWLDCGMFMQNVMIVAQAYGLQTCPQQAWCDYGAIVHHELEIPDDHVLLSGMALGTADTDAPENGLMTERVEVRSFATVHR